MLVLEKRITGLEFFVDSFDIKKMKMSWHHVFELISYAETREENFKMIEAIVNDTLRIRPLFDGRKEYPLLSERTFKLIINERLLRVFVFQTPTLYLLKEISPCSLETI